MDSDDCLYDCRVVIEMKVWTDRAGKEVGAKEFMVRWGEGIQKISPMQTTVIQLVGALFMLVGVVIGLFVVWSTTKWLFVILLGSFLLVIVNLIGTLKRYASLYLLAKQKREFLMKEEKE